MLPEFEVKAVRAAYANSSSEEIMEARNRSAKFPKAVEQTELLQQILEERLADEAKQQSAAEWSKAHTLPERGKKLTPGERKAKELERLKRLTKDGTVIPFVAPESPYRSQQEYEQPQKTRRVLQPKRDPRSCTTCSPDKPGPDCGGQCSVAGFWEARIMTPSEMAAADAKRGSKP